VLTRTRVYNVGFCGNAILYHIATPIDQGGEKPDIRTRGLVDANIRSERVVILVLSTNGGNHEVTPVIGVIGSPGEGPNGWVTKRVVTILASPPFVRIIGREFTTAVP
jgi:hypothetical protein